MKPPHQHRKPHNKTLLHPHPHHIHPQPQPHRLSRVPRRQQQTPYRLDHETDNVAPDEDAADARGAHAERGVRGAEAVDQPARRHVGEGVDPERREQQEELRERGDGLRLLVALADGAEGEGRRFPERAGDEDPAVFLCGVEVC